MTAQQRWAAALLGSLLLIVLGGVLLNAMAGAKDSAELQGCRSVYENNGVGSPYDCG